MIEIGQGVTALFGVENGPSLLLWPVAYTTACTTIQAMIIICQPPALNVHASACMFHTYII